MRSLITRVDALELRVSQDRQGWFSTELFEYYQRSGRRVDTQGEGDHRGTVRARSLGVLDQHDQQAAGREP
jgi:hypothetical protein